MPDLAVALNREATPRGGWMPALADALVETEDIELAVATAVNIQHEYQECIGKIKYYALPLPKGKIDESRLPESLINHYQQAVKDFNPDIIHVHGTEYFEGLLTGRGHLNCPVVVSIQGIIDACRKYYWGDIPLSKLLTSRTLRDWVRVDGLIEQKLKWDRRAIGEREVFANNPVFLGRTHWDRAYTRKLHPDARYHHCDEMLRDNFYGPQWDINNVTRHAVFASGAGYPLKGFHHLVKAVALLRDEFPDITIRTPLAKFYPELTGFSRFWKNQRSTGYARYLTDLIRKNNLGGHVVSYPLLDAEGMAREMLNAHVFVLPSCIENSPNSLAEAMMIGVPSVATFIGGIPSMARDGESSLFFPSGDEVTLAEQIRRIFLDDELASSLSSNARALAHARHSKEKIVKDLIGIYECEIRHQSL